MDKVTPFLSQLQIWTSLLLRISMQNHYRFVKQQGLSLPQMMILYHLQKVGDCTVSEIGEEFGISRAAASQLLDRLVQQGYLVRREHADDRRVKQMSLTAKGVQMIEQSMMVHQGWLRELAAQIDQSTQQRLYPFVEEMVVITKKWFESATICED